MTKILNLDSFFKKHDTFVLKPYYKNADYIEIEGELFFERFIDGYPTIADSYVINIKIPKSYPWDLPRVSEIGRKIPKDEKYHVNLIFDKDSGGLIDHYFCLGSELRLQKLIADDQSLESFVDRVVEPYLYSVSYKKSTGEKFPIGELAHYNEGLVQDYLLLFGLHTTKQLSRVLIALGDKKRLANKKPCPCGCKLRLGNCDFHHFINEFRNTAPRSRYRSIHSELIKEL